MASIPDVIDRNSLELELEGFRRELTGYCYRMLGSGFEAEDAVQETMVRAWRKLGDLESRAALKSWLYRIATNVCLDMLQGSQRRARPIDLGPASAADSALDPGLPEHAWIQPMPDAKVLPEDGDPAEIAAARETLRLAFVATLQHLPPKQRAVLILREVLRWKADEVAELLGTTTASVNSALQRARATLETAQIDTDGPADVDDEKQRELLARYVDAFERWDVEALVSLLHEDAEFTMPPYEFWVRGPEQVARFFHGHGIVCQGSRLLTTWANGCPAVAVYHEGGRSPWSIAVLEIEGDRIAAVHNFLYPELFETFGLPPRLDG